MNDRGRKYRMMLTNLSSEIKKRNVSLDMLKVTFVDFVNIKTELQNAINAFAIFMLLDSAGHVSQNNLRLLIAMIQLLGLTYLKDVIITSGFQYTEKVDANDVFSLFRRRVISIGKGLSDEHVNKISGVYEVPNENCSNQWRLLQYLQDSKILINNNELMEFIRTVSSVGVIIDDVDQLTSVTSSRANCDIIDHPSVTCSGSTCDETIFSDLLHVVADWYESREHTNMLKMLLRNVLKNNYNVKLSKDCLKFF